MAHRGAIEVDVERIDGDGHLVTLRGRVDIGSAADLRLLLHTVLDEGAGAVLLDLAECEVGDSTGLGLLVECLHRARRQRRRLVITEADARTVRLLRRVRLGAIVLPREPGPVVPVPALSEASA